MKMSATNYFADNFMENEGSSVQLIVLENVTAAEAEAFEHGSVLKIHYWNVSCLFPAGSEVESYSQVSWSFVEFGQDDSG